MPLACGETTSGSSGSVDPLDVALGEMDLPVDRRSKAPELPVREIPSHRHRDRAELPRRQRGEHELRRVAETDAEPVAEAEPALGQRAGELARTPVEVRPGESRLATVCRDEAEHLRVGFVGHELPDAGGNAHEIHARSGSIRSGSGSSRGRRSRPPTGYGAERRYGRRGRVPPRCGDCRVAHGGVHHHGCDVEECPNCGCQMVTCGCWFDEDGVDIADDEDMFLDFVARRLPREGD